MASTIDKRIFKRSALACVSGTRTWAFGLAFAAQYLSSGAAFACAFDMVKPERTTIDWIVDSAELVLARPKETDPFAFGVTQVLAGKTELPPIGQLVDSATRVKLAGNPSHAVLFAYQPETGWHRVAFVNESFQNVLKTTLDHRLSWQAAMPQSRLDFIATLQQSATQSHKAIAIAELDKVPYADLREFDLRISDEELLADLWTMDGYQYQAIRALLLGLSGTAAAREEIHDYINRVTEWDWANNLGAFAAAYIELEGAAGVEDLSIKMLHDPGQPLDKLEQIVMALSVHHGLATPPVKAAIQDAVGVLVHQRPEAGAIVARQFSLRSDWSQADVLKPLVRDRAVAMGDLLVISIYVARAREFAENATRVVYD